LARRQMAWFRRDPRIRWFPGGEDGAIGAVGEILTYLEKSQDKVSTRSIAMVEG